MVRRGEFPSDLYYRLNVFPLILPPLRERREDIAPLVRHFVEIFSRQMDKRIDRIPQQALDAFTAYSWHGNVRELQNTVERAIILSPGGVLHFDIAGPNVTGAPPAPTHVVSKPTLITRNELKLQERDGIAAALKQTGGKISGSGGAAELLGMKPTTLASRITALKISRKTG